MERIKAYEQVISLHGAVYHTVIIENSDEKTYDCYWYSFRHPLSFMFGLPIEQQPLETAMDIAVSNLPDYIDDDDD